MKKLFAVLLALALCVSVCSVTAFAEETEEMVPVCVTVPADWSGPCAWAWADDGTNAFAAWPGEPLEALGENTYYVYVPNFVQNIIINANDASVQTETIVVEAGKPVCITIADDLTATVSEIPEDLEIPEYVEKFVVHAYVPLSWETVNMWAWSAPDGTNAFASWPGEALTEGEDGWFTGRAPVWVNSLIINGNDGSVQTEDISIEGKELWITVYEDNSYELVYEDPTKAAENITVHAKVPADWSAPSCWAWSAPDGTNAFTSWPGEALTLEGDWYIIEVPGWINSVIINANEGSVQTADLSVEAGKDVWVIVNSPEDAVISYEEPAAGEVVDPAPESNNTGLFIGIGAVALLAIAGVVIGVVAKKKRK